MVTESDQLFKFKPPKTKRKPVKINGTKIKKINNNPKKDFSKVFNLNSHGKIKKKRVKKIVNKNAKKEVSPRVGYNIVLLEAKIQKLKDVEEPNKKIRKKLRQLEHLHKKITQQTLTEKSLGILNEDNNVELENHDDLTESNDKEESDKDISDENSEDEISVKRFVLFVGNLPKNTEEKDIRQHFAKVGVIKSVRIPEVKEPKKHGFAFIELEDRTSYEKTLSMHHTMLNNKRINVMYTIPDGKSYDKKEVMKKNAKLDALRKAGKLAGSVAEHKKRSFRRKKKRLAEAKASASLK